jgi:hypothetical protein
MNKPEMDFTELTGEMVEELRTFPITVLNPKPAIKNKITFGCIQNR